MTSTSQPKKDAKGDAGSEPDVKKPEADTKEPSTVPLGEHVETRQKLRAALDELAALKDQLAQSKKPSEPAAPQTPEDLKEIRETIAKIKDERQIEGLVRDLGLANAKQGQIVAKVLERNPDLSPTEALAHAAKREPDVFKDREQADAQKPGFSSLRPTPGSRPEPKPSDFKQRLDYIKSLQSTDKRLMDQHIRDVCASHAAKALKLEYQRLPLPQ